MEVVVPSVLPLRFWLGRWRVVGRDGTPAGENLVEPAVDGNVVLEHWRGVGGDEGKGLFFADPATGQWKQVWVQAGCVKKKLHDPAWRDGVRFVGTALVGESVVLEHWRGVGGDEGKGLFFADPATGQWKQVWVQAGCVKKKLHDPAWRDGVRFVGTALVGDRRIPDRTTLTPLDDGRVLQVIEQSRDGTSWAVGFEAVYEPLA